MKSFYSIIVPIYRVEPFISRCIESVLCQTFRNFELILVDDGSPDKSGHICDNYAAKDDRIKVIHTPNGGVSRARNIGISCASGDWLIFLDADDSLYEDNVLSQMHEKILSTTADLYQYQVIRLYNARHSIDLVAEGIYTINGKEYRNLKPKRGAASNYIFSNEIVQKNAIFFPETARITEDQAFTYSYLAYCDTIKICNVPFYVYHINENVYNSSSSLYNDRRFLDAIGHINAIFQVVSHLMKSRKNKSVINERIAMLILHLILLSTCLTVSENVSLNRYLKEQVPFRWGYTLNNKFLFVLLAYLNMNMAVYFLRLYKKIQAKLS